jgi:HSP20 family protein
METMKALTQWDSFREPERAETMSITEWTPLVDVTEDAQEYLIKAELPEVKKGDVKVSVENGTLKISGERVFAFVRSFTLPVGTACEKVSADFKDGVLKVHLPKSRAGRPKSIDVKVG